MNRSLSSSLTLTGLLVAGVAQAHSGPHGHSHGLLHFLSQADHVAGLVLGTGAVIGLVAIGRRLLSRG